MCFAPYNGLSSAVAQFHLIILSLMFPGVAHDMHRAIACFLRNTITAGVQQNQHDLKTTETFSANTSIQTFRT